MSTARRNLRYRVITAVILCVFALCSLTPFAYLIVTSLVKDMSLVFKNGIALQIQPEMLGFSNYSLLFTENGGIYFSWFKNSMLIYNTPESSGLG